MTKEIKDNKDKIIGIRVSTETRDKLQKLADADGRTLSNYILFHLEKLTKAKK